ncbi:MAG: helix-turn-helix domain-containing protein, partial [Planctomycetes bacterium]|nr:helix-turn-helix domain-containing protein [Planctomycetota bacterium]
MIDRPIERHAACGQVILGLLESFSRSAPCDQSPTERSPRLAACRRLGVLGERVRTLRAHRQMTRKALARDSRVSERYLAQLEQGRGNI